MTQALAYLNGKFIPADRAVVPVWDAGFVLGASVAEQLRTFGGRLFQLDAHLDRLERSLGVVDVALPISRTELVAVAEQVVRHNHGLLAPDSDLGLTIVVTPGPYPTLAPAGHHGPLLCVTTYELPFERWVEAYRLGQSLVTTSIEQVSPHSWPRHLKCRSRVHYYLADQEAARQEPLAKALLLDSEGYVVETATANVLVYRRDTGIASPPRDTILPGVSLDWVARLAGELNTSFDERPLRPDDLAGADEVWLASTPFCLLPVTRFNGKPIGDGRPGQQWSRFLTHWGQQVGVDILDQAQRRTGR